MAGTKRGNGKVVDVTVRILTQIRDEIRGLREEFVELRGEFVELRRETREGLAAVNARLENLRDLAGDRYRSLDSRVRVLEERAGIDPPDAG